MQIVTLLLCGAPFVALAAPRMLRRDWAQPLSLSKVAVAASVPDAAAAIAHALTRLGAEVQVNEPGELLDETGLRWRPEVLGRTVVLAGGIHTNRAMLPLYAGHLSLGDAAYPGVDGYLLRTVARPFGVS